MSQYIISLEAIRDLDAVTDYFAIQSPDVGDRLLDEFTKKCRYLTQFPLMGRSYPDIRPYLRGIPMQDYIIFYRVFDDGIEILRVIRGDRDLEAIFEKDP
ncbi:type II toxin-antitoxin system RelE/ParE family toxin [Phormidesmis priestleyi]